MQWDSWYATHFLSVSCRILTYKPELYQKLYHNQNARISGLLLLFNLFAYQTAAGW